jgi:hypothetical protein
LRGIFIPHGVAAQLNPVEVFTAAPGGVEVTWNWVEVPRVTVAQPLRPAPSASAEAARAKNFIIPSRKRQKSMKIPRHQTI